MGRVLRRTVVKALGAAAATAALGACTTAPAPAQVAAPTAAKPTTKPTAKPTTNPAAKPRPKTTAPAKTFAVGVRDLKLARGTDRPLPTTVWSPTAAGKFPLILFSHGFTARPSDYADLLVTWAKAGFVVAAPAYPHTAAGVADYNVLDVINQPADAAYVITQVLAKVGNRVDRQRIAAAGHSAGGITTLEMFSGNRDDRLVAGVVLAGRQILAIPFTGPSAPLLFVHGKLDDTIAYADGRAAYDAVPWPKAFLTVTKGGHVTTPADFGVVATTTTDFWRWSLYGDSAAKARLPRDAAAGKVATLANHL
jgi:fermentation-respiration switch protein FrsA (DUF1100 family)